MNGVDEIRAVVERHEFPFFVHGLQVRLGEYDGDPAVWLTFQTDIAPGMDETALMTRAKLLSQFRHQVFVDLMQHSVGPYPFFRFEDKPDGNTRH